MVEMSVLRNEIRMEAAETSVCMNVENSTDAEAVSGLRTAVDTGETLVSAIPKAVRPYAFYHHETVCRIGFPEAAAVGEYAFSDCGLLESVSVPKAADIGESAFRGCALLETADISGAESLGSSAFSGCGSLRSVRAKKLRMFGNNAFSSCKSLRTIGSGEKDSLILPESYNGSFTASNAFSYAEHLVRADLRQTTEVSGGVFYGCTNLDALILRSGTRVTISGTFTDTPIAAGTGCIYVPAALLDEYTATYPKYRFRTIEDHPELPLYRWKKYRPERTYTFVGWTGDTVTSSTSSSVTVYPGYRLNEETGIVEVTGTSSYKSASSLTSGYRKSGGEAQKYVRKTSTTSGGTTRYTITWQKATVMSTPDWDTLTYVEDVYSTIPDRHPDDGNDGEFYYVKVGEEEA